MYKKKKRVVHMGQCTRLLYHSSMDQNIKFVNDYAPSPLRKKSWFRAHTSILLVGGFFFFNLFRLLSQLQCILSVQIKHKLKGWGWLQT